MQQGLHAFEAPRGIGNFSTCVGNKLKRAQANDVGQEKTLERQVVWDVEKDGLLFYRTPGQSGFFRTDLFLEAAHPAVSLPASCREGLLGLAVLAKIARSSLWRFFEIPYTAAISSSDSAGPVMFTGFLIWRL